jgi:uncharacterized membrane protein
MAIAQEWEKRERQQQEQGQREGQTSSMRSSDQRGSERTYGRLANGLGWFSIGLGLAEVAAPGRIAQLIGVRDDGRTRNVLRAYGVREITSGVGILSQRNPAQWLWSRVAGDVLDLASLGRALKSDEVNRTRATAATTAVLGVTAIDAYCAQQLSRTGERGRERDRAVRVRKSVLVNRSPEEVYRFWRDFSNLPKFMSHIESVQIIDDRRSHWRAKGPGGTTVEWEAEILEDRPNELIAWRSVEESDVEHFGSVHFEAAPGGRGTLVRVQIQYAPPGGAIAAKIAKLFGGVPGLEITRDLRAFKQVMEVGEVVKSEASIHPGIHAARPA